MIGNEKRSVKGSYTCDEVAYALPNGSTACSDPKFLARELAIHGIRMTAQRRMLLEIIGQSPGHMDAAALLQRAHDRDGQVHRATVY